MTPPAKKGVLYVIPSWLSEDMPAAAVVPAAALERLRLLERFVVENAKSARAFLAAIGHPRPMRELVLEELDEHTPPEAIPGLVAPLLEGHDVGLLSEAGAPAVADPGARLVAAAHAHAIRVVPLAGPSAILLALMASGLEGQRFRFAGYLPAGSAERRRAIAELERRSASADETQVFIETPYRNDALLADLLACAAPETRLAVAVDLTGRDEAIRLDRIARWREIPMTIGKRPAVFLLLAERARRS